MALHYEARTLPVPEMLPNGNWIGRGRCITREHVLGEPIECSFKVSSEDPGIIIEGHLAADDEARQREFSIVISADDSGTYDLDVHFDAWALAGTAKLESQPCLGLLWSADRSLDASFALFDLPSGHGLRGIIHAGTAVLSWELALQERHRVLGGDNVVTLSARRQR